MNETTNTESRELVLTRVYGVPREKMFQAWSDPSLLARWWAPPGLTLPVCEVDFRTGGTFRTVMRTADGTDHAGTGVFLEVVAPERIIFTDAFESAWMPSAKPFMLVVVTLEAEGAGTLYTTRVRHWSVADRNAHDAMGFYAGWGACADQLAALATTL